MIPCAARQALQATLRGASRFDVQGFNVELLQPLSQCIGNELEPVVRTNMLRRAMSDKQLSQDIQHITAVEFAFHEDRQTFASAFINHAQHAEHLPIMSAILNEVIAPGMTFMLWSQSDA